MSHTTIDGLARRAANAVSRRHSLQMGAAAVAASAWQPVRNAVAGNGGNGGAKGSKKCRRQRAQCEEVVRERCQPANKARAIAAPEDCVSRVLPCCEHFAKCHAGAALDCMLLKPVK